MSLRAMLWAINEAPVENTEEWAVLVAMADPAWDDGSHSCLGVTTIAERTLMSERSVQRHRAALEARGLITQGDQNDPYLLSLRADRRPVHYLLSLHMSRGDWMSPRGERGDSGVTPSGSRGDTGVTRTTTTSYSTPISINSQMEAAAAHLQVGAPSLDQASDPMEDSPIPVTSRNPDQIPWTSVHLLKTVFHVTSQEQVDAWRSAWRTAVQVATDYDVDTHLVAYLTRCQEERREVKASRWLKFVIEDRAKWVVDERAHADRLQQQATADGGEQWALNSLRRTPRWNTGGAGQ